MREAEEAARRLKPVHREALREAVELARQLTVDELLALVYTVYGEHEKSEVADRILARRVDLAVSMLRKGAISLTLAARVAGKPLKEFVEELRKRGVKPFKANVGDIDEAAAWFEENSGSRLVNNNSSSPRAKAT